MHDDDVAVPGGRGRQGVPAVLVMVGGDELAERGERLEAAARLARALEDEGGDGDVDAVDKVRRVVCGEGARVEDEGVAWRGEGVCEDVWLPGGGGDRELGNGRVVGGVVGRGRGRGGPGERGEGAYGAEAEVVVYAGAEAGKVGECALEVVGVDVGGGEEGKVELVVVVGVGRHCALGRSGGR